MEKLKDAIGLSLRRGDVYTRFSVSQYLVLLPSASYENSIKVVERIIRAFRQQSPKAAVTIKYSVQPMTPDGINPVRQ